MKDKMLTALLVIAAVMVAACGSPRPTPPATPTLTPTTTPTGTWTVTNSMSVARADHTATLLQNGKVLVAGGDNGSFGSSGILASAELYDPNTGTWTPTGSLNVARYYHTATLLQNGKVLVAGGYNHNSDTDLASAELFR